MLVFNHFFLAFFSNFLNPVYTDLLFPPSNLIQMSLGVL